MIDAFDVYLGEPLFKALPYIRALLNTGPQPVLMLPTPVGAVLFGENPAPHCRVWFAFDPRDGKTLVITGFEMKNVPVVPPAQEPPAQKTLTHPTRRRFDWYVFKRLFARLFQR